MGTVVFAGVDAPLLVSLRKNTTLARTRFEEVGDTELALARLRDTAAEVDAMVIGPGVTEAMALAQRIHAADRDVAVILLTEQGRSAEIAEALRFTPFLGPEVSFCERTPDEAVEHALSLAVQRTRQRRGYRAAMTPWRRRLALGSGRSLRSDAVLEGLLVRLPLGVILLESGGAVSSFNRRAAEFLAKSEREMAGAPLVDLVPPRLAPALQALLSTAFAGDGAPALTFELERAEGARTLELTVASVAGKSSAQGLLVLLMDVTERERTAREREQLRAEIESSQRLASLGMLAAGVGHEINNPLTYVMGNVQFVLDRLEERDTGDRQSRELRELLRDALEGANRIRSIVRDLRTFSRLETLTPAPVDVTEVIDSALAIVWNELRHRARVVKKYDSVDKVRGDAARLGQVFLNLLTNAAQAIRGGQADSNLIRISVERGSPGQLVVGIFDTGSGISSEILGKIFDPFFTTKPVGQGTGLGLAICQRIVAEHAGTILVESQPGKGTNVRVTLPTVLVDAIPEGVPSVPAPAAPVEPRARILVVDDEPAVGGVVALVLGREHAVTVVTTGEAAVAHLEAGERFDAILCDVMMPSLGGPAVHERILDIDAEQAERMVFMSGGVFSPDAQAYLARLPNARLDKPFSAEQLRLVVREVTVSGRAPEDAARSPRRILPA